MFVDAAATRPSAARIGDRAGVVAGGRWTRRLTSCGNLVRRPALAKRYLAVEGQRALAANEDLLPYPVRSLIDPTLATRADSPAASLAVAGGRKVADPPASFGVIRARNLLTAHASVRQSGCAGVHDPRRKPASELSDSRRRGRRRRRRRDGSVLQPSRWRRRGRQDAARDAEQGASAQRRWAARGRHPDAPTRATVFAALEWSRRRWRHQRGRRR